MMANNKLFFKVHMQTNNRILSELKKNDLFLKYKNWKINFWSLAKDKFF